MILVADSGSTKTHWRALDNGGQTDIFASGINPFYQTENTVAECLSNELLPQLNRTDAEQIFFYGAGCHFPDKKKLVENALRQIFPSAEIGIYNDLLGACRALFGKRAGIACIMGTGSNSCFYNGVKIVENVSPLGFVLGDEGSGAVLGKLLVGNVLKKQFSPEICVHFFEKYNVDTQTILENVYKKPFPNRYLAAFAPFVKEYIDDPEMKKMVRTAFRDFFVRNVMQYADYKSFEISFVGSVAFHLQTELAEVANELGLTIGSICQSPMDRLSDFHQKNLK